MKKLLMSMCIAFGLMTSTYAYELTPQEVVLVDQIATHIASAPTQQQNERTTKIDAMAQQLQDSDNQKAKAIMTALQGAIKQNIKNQETTIQNTQSFDLVYQSFLQQMQSENMMQTMVRTLENAEKTPAKNVVNVDAKIEGKAIKASVDITYDGKNKALGTLKAQGEGASIDVDMGVDSEWLYVKINEANLPEEMGIPGQVQLGLQLMKGKWLKAKNEDMTREQDDALSVGSDTEVEKVVKLLTEDGMWTQDTSKKQTTELIPVKLTEKAKKVVDDADSGEYAFLKVKDQWFLQAQDDEANIAIGSNEMYIKSNDNEIKVDAKIISDQKNIKFAVDVVGDGVDVNVNGTYTPLSSQEITLPQNAMDISGMAEGISQ